MKNKGRVIVLIILLAIIVALLTMFLVFSINGGRRSNGLISFGTESSNVIFEKTYEMEDIKNIEIIQDAGDIIFKESTKDSVGLEIYGDNEKDVEVNLVDGKLTIDNKAKKKFVFFGFGNVKNNIVVYIPSNYENDIKIRNDYGDCKIIDLENATVDIDCDAGDIALGKIKNAIVKCDYGDIKIEEVLNKCDIKLDYGDIKINKISIKENSEIKVDYGDIDIKEVNDIYIDAEVEMGSKDVYTNNRQSDITLKIRCDFGDIKVK